MKIYTYEELGINWYDKKYRKFLRFGEDPPSIPPEKWKECPTNIEKYDYKIY